MFRQFNRIPLNDSYNIRDLGGYPCLNGKATRYNLFYRSGDLSYSKEDDLDLLYKHGVKTIIDLRCEVEITREKGLVFNDDRFTHIVMPLIDDFEKLIPYSYFNMINIFKKNMKRIFTYISENIDKTNFLFHCVSGKDRTGIISALLFMLAGVSEEDIAANYMVSCVYLWPDAKRYNRTPEQIKSDPSDIMNFLEVFIHEYVTARNYFLHIGLKDDEINKIINYFTI
ncbi:MAG: tyrosine-protein phosphatase [Eubacteriales bacterium]